jgi:alpha-galactosidase
MPITFDTESRKIHLFNENISYILALCAGRFPESLYFGKRVRDYTYAPRSYGHDARPLFVCLGDLDEKISLDHIRQEYPSYGSTDFHYPAFTLLQENGSRVSRFEYESHVVYPSKKSLSPLPSVYTEDNAEADSIDISLHDKVSKTRLILTYSIFAGLDAVTRSVRFEQEGDSSVTLERAMSFSIDLPDSDFEMLQLSGAWARERQVRQRALVEGVQSVHSMRGSSSAEHNPFIALKRPSTNEDSGEAYGFSLVYSGNFLAQAEVDTFGSTRVMMGIHPDTFRWPLAKGESFTTPEAILVYSDDGLNGMSQTFHSLFRTRLARGSWRDSDRPILLNNWEATGCDFTEAQILDMAHSAKDLGIELVVLDDGWFGARNSDRAGLGDWTPNLEKLPGGIAGLARKIEAEGLKFGLWFEPEMVNADSDLYRAHPDWILRTPGRVPSVGRNQYVLDFSRGDVVDLIFESVSSVLRGAPVSYVKWDMNRYLTECRSAALESDAQGTVFHRYVLGVYRLYDSLTRAFPDILFESCSSGGARFDPGILAFAPQTWTSDDSDAIERLRIQWGTSLAYPLSSMGNHVSAVPNQQVSRITPLATRAHVAFFGELGYELDLDELDAAERDQVREQIAYYKKHRSLVREGLFFRLRSPFAGNVSSWMVSSRDGNEALVGCYRTLNWPNQGETLIKLRGLESKARYAVEGKTATFFGDELMHSGLPIGYDEWSTYGDFASAVYYLKKA